MRSLRSKLNKPCVFVLVFAAVNVLCLAIALLLLFLDVDPRSVLGRRSFSDFLETMAYALCGNPYGGMGALNSNYPPLPILLAYPFALLCRGTVESYLGGGIALQYAYKNADFVCTYLLYFVLSAAFLCFSVWKFVQKRGGLPLWAMLAVLFSGPVLYCFGRGNVLLPAMACIFLFFAWYDSEKRALRELSLLFLALAVAFKLYPAVLALLLIKERRYLDFFKTALYSVILVFLPLVCFSGGFGETVLAFLKGVVGFDRVDGRDESPSNVSFDRILGWVVSAVGLFGADIASAMGIVSMALHAALLLFTAVMAFLVRGREDLHGRYTVLLCCAFLYFSKVSYGYNLLVFAVPCLYFYRERATYAKADRIACGIAYFLLFFPALYLFKYFYLQVLAPLYLLVSSCVGLIGGLRRGGREEPKAENGEERESSGSPAAGA